MIEQLQKYNISKPMKLISRLFDADVFIIIILILYIFKILNIKDILFILIGYIICTLLKIIFKRTRPFNKSNTIINYSNKKYYNIYDKYSFPSSHTFMATIFFLILLKKYPKAYIFYIFIILIGFSRIILGVHYPTDVLGGIVFGSLYYLLIKSKL